MHAGGDGGGTFVPGGQGKGPKGAIAGIIIVLVVVGVVYLINR
ncbi:hypothetical protein ACIRRH_38690 [Kitasatospora sp. NPDC101235]